MLLDVAPYTMEIYYDKCHYFGQYSTLCHILVLWTGTTVKPLTFTRVYILDQFNCSIMFFLNLFIYFFLTLPWCIMVFWTGTIALLLFYGYVVC